MRIDRFRIVAALLIVAIHTYPLTSVNETFNFLLVHVFARVGVPFFLMASGYFLLGRKKSALIQYTKKTIFLYIGATALYLPFSLYAGHYTQGSVFAMAIKNILVEGTFYHLWYLPAAILGLWLVYGLSRKFSFPVVLSISGGLYLLGLLGDSYYGLAVKIPALEALYNAYFKIFSFSRNGLFYTPIFICLGASMAKEERRLKETYALIGLILSLLLWMAEGFILRRYGCQRHDSLYFMLIPCAYFLFTCLLNGSQKGSPVLRIFSLWIYILHPLCIILVRGIAKISGTVSYLVDNSLIHYLAVCLLSILLSGLMAVLLLQFRNKHVKCKNSTFNPGRAWIELDRQNLRHNISVLQQVLPKECQLMPAVKANAYGHGANAIARELNALDIRAFCVASVSEGVSLRKGGVKGEILILGYTDPSQFNLLQRYRMTQTVVDYEYARRLNTFGKKLNVHIKIDTGMRRLGELFENEEKILGIFDCRYLQIKGIYTHLCADDSECQRDKAFTRAQIERFFNVLSMLTEKGITLPKIHLQSSNGIFNHPELSFDYARAGLAVYGLIENRDLRPVLSLKARISLTKTLTPGEAAGYGLAFTAQKETKIAVLSIGYADGIPRNLSCGVGYVLIDGKKAPVIGRVCMDQMTVDITDIEKAEQGDIAVLLGKSKEAEITVYEIAQRAETIPNEIISRLSERLERYSL